MKKALPILISLLLMFPAQNFAQKKRKAKKPAAVPSRPGMSPCGVYYASWDEFFEEMDRDAIRWRKIGRSHNEAFFYNGKDTICDADRKVLKTWIKAIPDSPDGHAYSLELFELNCRTYQLRRTSQTKYTSTGDIVDFRSIKEAEWDDVIPDSIGQTIFNTACRRGQ